MADITVLIVDDQPLMLHALQTFIENEDGVSVAGTAEDGEAAVEAAKSLQPDLVLMDIKMPRLNGIEATRKIVSEIPGTRVLALTTFSTLDYVVPALRAGAAGYLVKDARPDEILAAIRNAMDDSLPLSPSVVRLMARQVIGGALDTQAVAGATATEVGLAPREISVLQFLGNGLSNREIAKKMYISEGSVKAYLANACTKLGVRDRLQAVIRGFELGIVSPRLSAGE
ncbi:response regulator transcription factor [Arachnia propionica]|jgi:response regulator containing a cheY-like receiver domain and an HTH DNA-binding domain|uniref:Response regulator protein vraR n=1 Tax=Arachnia propionica TaxID=1750 RepID=A0A3N4D1H7_9ACTN|nr:response regulator transcription factor [Arachnia propionica]AFN46001.1 response regulator receiver domain protein [Arachnia propionica F0230a]QCT36634.1 response regulator transcription factor [Arachnia propionica]QUC11043.1 response regulator transcription factor [Arachnia propionica]RPA17902.1 DNA-binding response regulator [Arachnia propionica]VEH68872.1 Response regulator protein vraR [Arachnia propionica]